MSKLKLSFSGPQANGLSSILWLVKNVPLFSIISPMISYFEHGQFTLAQTTESLRIGLQALKSLSFGRKLVSSKYQTCKFELWTKAFSASSIKLPKFIESLSSQLEY